MDVFFRGLEKVLVYMKATLLQNINFKIAWIIGLILIIQVLILCKGASGQSSNEETANLPEPTEVKNLYFKKADHNFTIYIYLPPDYDSTNNMYPIQYVLDGQASLDELTVFANNEVAGREYLTIGIGYTDVEDEMQQNRLKYLTPTPVQGLEGSGGGKVFHDFLRLELLPYIKENYRIDSSEQTIIGHSLSGFFVLYCLFTDPVLFNNYISISPSLAISDFQTERNSFSVPKNSNLKLFLAAGSNENQERMLTPFQELDHAIPTLEEKGLILKKILIEGEDHFSVVTPALKESLIWLDTD